jgi:hypothetical protein
MNLIDRISAVAVLALGFVGAAWWFGVWVPERDEYLLAVHDCYVEAGCADRIQDDSEIETCWSICSTRVRENR